MNLSTALPLAMVLMVGSMVHSDPPETDGPLDRVAWLAGRWIRHGPGLTAEEHWMYPRGKTMLGMARTVKDGETVDYEYLRIEDRGGMLVYVAIPSCQRETEFTQTELTDSTAVFSNPSHDFPQIIRYQRLGDDSLLAQIEGEVNGQRRVIDFPMRRVQSE